ncbi:hypothetical protein EGR_02677 [Echinococcus granulosus]|uniref:Uncharacterized protein n=1 Tax=Echinococcus granulosus TaxID=6210 RepID=W6ULY0_ECHGR|nr:hypothetical protein EGR_02677 [Echinococcus granulosus]EUB62545.1 hypothetical protein EGR_02677 [Echinococcus granulosus]
MKCGPPHVLRRVPRGDMSNAAECQRISSQSKIETVLWSFVSGAIECRWDLIRLYRLEVTCNTACHFRPPVFRVRALRMSNFVVTVGDECVSLTTASQSTKLSSGSIDGLLATVWWVVSAPWNVQLAVNWRLQMQELRCSTRSSWHHAISTIV